MPYTNITTRQDSVICEKHWPESYPTVSIKGRTRPKDPPSVSPGVPPSCVQDLLLVHEVQKKKSSMEVRNSKPHELDSFREMDRVSYNDIVDKVVIKKHNFRCPVVAFCNDISSNLRSVNFSEGLPKFLLVINESLEFKPSTWAIRFSIFSYVVRKTTSGF